MTKAFGVDVTDSGRSSRKSVLVGPDGKVAKAYDPVVPAEHTDQVLGDLG
jgi:peroxiredoxin